MLCTEKIFEHGCCLLATVTQRHVTVNLNERDISGAYSSTNYLYD